VNCNGLRQTVSRGYFANSKNQNEVRGRQSSKQRNYLSILQAPYSF
jgi:hypothetical protein